MKLNTEALKSVAFKLLPVVVTYLVGAGVVDQATADQIPGVVEALLVVASFVPTLVRSYKMHKKVGP